MICVTQAAPRRRLRRAYLLGDSNHIRKLVFRARIERAIKPERLITSAVLAAAAVVTATSSAGEVHFYIQPLLSSTGRTVEPVVLFGHDIFGLDIGSRKAVTPRSGLIIHA